MKTSFHMHKYSMRNEWGQYLHSFHWHHYATLTMRRECGETFLTQEFKRYIRCLEYLAKNAVGWWMVVEQGKLGRKHIHALLSNTRHLSNQKLKDAWQLGHAQIHPYNTEQGAAYYVAKHLTSDETLSDFSKRHWPRLRH
jgi:hypothetical protein